jgi:hypothetical protein
MNSSLLNNSTTIFHSLVFFKVFFMASVEDIFVLEVEDGFVSIVARVFYKLSLGVGYGPSPVLRNEPHRLKNSLVAGSLKKPRPLFYVI